MLYGRCSGTGRWAQCPCRPELGIIPGDGVSQWHRFLPFAARGRVDADRISVRSHADFPVVLDGWRAAQPLLGAMTHPRKIIPVYAQLPNKPSTRRAVGSAPEYGINYRKVAFSVGLNPEHVVDGKLVNRGTPRAFWLLVVTL